jgi:NitT/TauT family transport system substrate-binding protein
MRPTPLLAAMTAFTALAGIALLPPADAQTPIKITIASPSSDDVTPALYADRAGIFKKYGLDVEVLRMANGSAIAAAIAGGSVSFGLNNAVSIAVAHAHNVPLQIVAPGGLYTGDDAAQLVVPIASSAKTARDLNGKTAGSPSVRDLATLSTMAWIDQHGGDSSTIKVVEVPSPSLGPALSQGRIDMATVQVPALADVIDSGKARSIGRPYTGIAQRFLLSAWIAAPDYIDKNPEAVRRFSEAIREATRYTNAHHSETLAAISAFSGVDAAVIARGTRSNPPLYVDPKLLQPIVDREVQYKFIDKSFDAKDMVSAIALPPS